MALANRVGEVTKGARRVGEAADELGVSSGTIRNWIDKGYIRAIQLPSGHRRIPESEVQRLLSQMFDVASGQDPAAAGIGHLGRPVDDSGEPAF